jgi:hypothetical protein
MTTCQTHTHPDGTVIEVLWNVRPRARTRHEARLRREGTDDWTAWYPFDDQAMTDLFGLTVPDRYR